MDVDPKLLEILVCPLTKTTVIYDRERQELISKKAGHGRMRVAHTTAIACRC